MMVHHGSVSVCSADNPASNLLGGYKYLFSALRKCRHCMAVKDDMEVKVRAHASLYTYTSHSITQFTAEEFIPRARVDQDEHYKRIETCLWDNP